MCPAVMTKGRRVSSMGEAASIMKCVPSGWGRDGGSENAGRTSFGTFGDDRPQTVLAYLRFGAHLTH